MIHLPLADGGPSKGRRSARKSWPGRERMDYEIDELPDDGEPGAGLPVIQTPLIFEAARWEAHIKLGAPYRTAYEAKMRHYLALCAKAKIRAKSIPLVVAFRCGYWQAAGDPVAIDSEALAKE